MSEPQGGNGHDLPEGEGETMMAAVIARAVRDNQALQYELRLNPAMSLQEQCDFCIMLAAMAATSAGKLRSQERRTQIQVPDMKLPPDFKLPPNLTGRRGKGRG